MYVVFFIHKMQANVLHSFSIQYIKKQIQNKDESKRFQSFIQNLTKMSPKAIVIAWNLVRFSRFWGRNGL